MTVAGLLKLIGIGPGASGLFSGVKSFLGGIGGGIAGLAATGSPSGRPFRWRIIMEQTLGRHLQIWLTRENVAVNHEDFVDHVDLTIANAVNSALSGQSPVSRFMTKAAVLASDWPDNDARAI